MPKDVSKYKSEEVYIPYKYHPIVKK